MIVTSKILKLTLSNQIDKLVITGDLSITMLCLVSVAEPF